LVGHDIYYHVNKRILTPFRKKYLNFKISEHRRKVKLQCIEYKGGKCKRCGYDKCPAALEFHHLDPTQKDFGISTNGNSRSFEKCKIELDKCMLVCSNCHAEIHHEEFEKAREIKRQEIEEEKRSYKKPIPV
jgi:hypothetical protein